MFILSILLLFATIIFYFVAEKNVKLWVVFGCGLLTVLFFILSILFVVNPGELGIEVLFGSVKKYSENGMHIKNPFSNIIVFDMRTIKENHKTDGTSQDLQLISVECAVQYRINNEQVKELYQKVGKDYSTIIIDPGIQDAVKAATSVFKVEQIITERAKLKELIEKMLVEKFNKFYIILQDFQITDIDFSPEFNKVVEEKQIEEQRIKTAEYRRMQAENEKQTVILQAQAEGEKQRLLRANTSPEVISLKWIEKWNGNLPTTILGNNAVPMINLAK